MNDDRTGNRVESMELSIPGVTYNKKEPLHLEFRDFMLLMANPNAEENTTDNESDLPIKSIVSQVALFNDYHKYTRGREGTVSLGADNEKRAELDTLLSKLSKAVSEHNLTEL